MNEDETSAKSGAPPDQCGPRAALQGLREAVLRRARVDVRLLGGMPRAVNQTK
jgi:hypothetical protein